MNRLSKGFIEITLILYAVAAAALVAGLWYIYHLGGVHQKEEDAALFAEERTKRYEMVGALAIELGDRGKARYEENQKIINQLYDIEKTWKEKGVTTRYVACPPNTKCFVTNGWVRYHDERAAGLPAGAGPPVGTARTPSGVEEATALETTGDNYALFFQCKERVRQVIQKYDDVQSITNSAVKRMNERVKNIERKLQ